ncbi:phage/plasmid primase, P4 family [Rhodovulum sp. FJ3]|uniref:phage/plasmid primase, P4 family n=1 Tax=Rhodovulum sp. FJ3 TaxID=3079053 RepID=UPI00293DDF7B|nr:phage/plasmid primase, P4 family [Rhodovulum sp. FJ3]MDV4168231.1 phage/plasmid primase, P4 family [Rhodovulum sp. FJ3]
MILPDRFILYRREFITDKAKWQKIPCDTQGDNIDPHKPQHWMTYAEAQRHATWDENKPSAPYGVGFVLNGDGWWFHDLDNCLGKDGQWEPWAEAAFLSFKGALGEISTSGNGLHILGRCDPKQLADRKRKWGKSQGQEQEWYHDKRFVALSKAGLTVIGGGDYVDKDWTDQLLKIVPQRDHIGELAEEIDPAYTGPEDDDQLIAMMLRSRSAKNAFGAGVSLKNLWEADTEALAQKYPAFDGNGGFDHSSADAALMTHLAFWTGRDMPRMDRLFRRSALMRDKYEKRADYRRNTIQNAARRCEKVYDRAPRNVSSLDQCHADMGHDDLAHHIFAQRWAGNMLYVPERNRWAGWNGKRWQLAKDPNEQITRLRQDLREVPGAEDPSKRKRLGDNKNIMAVNALMKTNEGAARSIKDWDTDPFLLGTPTKIVDLHTGEVRPRTSSDYLLCSSRFDPAEKGSIPLNWISFLRTITGGDDALVDFLQRLCGYAATGSTKEHKLFFAFGTGRNGKSTLLNTLDAVLSDDYARVIPPKLLLDKKTDQHSTDLAHLANARFARASELPVGKVWDEGLLKQITGGDQITARLMRQDNFTFKPQCTLIVDANNAPSIRGIDEAFRRRMCVIPFNVTITEQQVDPDLPDKLLAEGPAITRWIIEGAAKWNKDGLCIPPCVKAATADYLDQEDTFGAFLNEHFEDDPNGVVLNAELHQKFKNYMESLGLPPWGAASISKEMKKRGYESFKSGSSRGFRGISARKSSQLAVLP